MLLGQNSRRRQKGNLLTAHNGLKGGPHCNFGFTVTYISADKPIHRNGLFHVLFYLSDAGKLVIGFFIRKSRFKSCLPFIIFLKSKARARLSFRIKIDEFCGYIFNRFFYLVLSVLPRL